MKALFVAFGLALASGAAQAQDFIASREDFSSALRAFDQENYARAAALFERLVERDPARGLFWFNLGNSSFKLTDYIRAEQAYRKVIQLGSPLALPARLYLAKALRNQGRLDEARGLLSALGIEPLPEGLKAEAEAERAEIRLSYLDQALTAYRNGDYTGTLRLLDASSRLRDGIDSSALRGLALLQLGRPSEAEKSFSAVLEMPARSEAERSLQADARDFLAQIRNREWPKEIPFWAFVEAAAGYNSNLFGDAQADGPLGHAIATLTAGLGYQRAAGPRLSFGGAYDLMLNEVPGESSARFLENTLAAFGVWDNRVWHFRLQGGIAHDLVETDSFLWVPGVTLSADRRVGPGRFGLRYFFRRNVAGSSLYDYLEGNLHSGSLRWSHSGRSWTYGLKFLVSRHSTGDLVLTDGTLPLAHTSFGPGIEVRWNPFPRWKFEGSTHYFFLDYAHASQPTGQNRDDRQWNGFLRGSFTLVSSLDFFVSGTATLNHSSLTAADIKDKNYRQFIVLGGLSWNLLP